MKRSTTLYAVTAIAALSFASQAFARGGSMGVSSQSHGSTGSTHQMATSMPQNMGATAASTAMQQGAGNVSGMQQKALHGQMNGSTSTPAAPRMTTATSK
jgi:hypothetical protein